MYKKLSEIQNLKLNLDTIVTELKADDADKSKAAGIKLARLAAEFGVSLGDFFRLAFQKDKDGLDGFEQILFRLNLPVRDDFSNGVYLQAANDTFQTYPGTRALFPEVVDEVLRFAARQEQLESVAPMLANSRVINGNEMLSTVVDNDLDDGENDSFQVPELGRIPVRTIKTSEQAVKIWKHGSGIRTSYEFQRRASLDLMRPHANRMARELERSKVTAATSILINGDGAYGAAATTAQSSFNSATGETAVNGKINWANFLAWLVARAKLGIPVDTLVMNWDAHLQWALMFGKPSTISNGSFGPTGGESLSKMGFDTVTSGVLIGTLSQITPVLSSAVPANKIVGITKGDTLEELREAGSDIQETEKAIQNQSITMYKTENTGYKLVYGDTREVYNFGG